MTNDDELARKARAKRLRKQIKRLISRDEKRPEERGGIDETERESPREFIERKMKELESKETTQEPKKKEKRLEVPCGTEEIQRENQPELIKNKKTSEKKAVATQEPNKEQNPRTQKKK